MIIFKLNIFFLNQRLRQPVTRYSLVQPNRGSSLFLDSREYQVGEEITPSFEHPRNFPRVAVKLSRTVLSLAGNLAQYAYIRRI